ncbi:MAG: VWA domain-containing protein [Bacteroidales bacterium]|nr:VWA domain-containing protein [Bacteroidales bacterium]
MKRIFLILFHLFFVLIIVKAQGVFEYEVTVIGKDNSGQSGVKVWLEEKVTGEKIIKRSNYLGHVNFNIPEGYWTLNLVGMPDYKEVIIGKGERGQGSVTVFYDLAEIRALQELEEKRKNMIFNYVYETRNITGYPGEDSCILKIKLVNSYKRPVSDIAVEAVSVEHGAIFSGTTNWKGMVAFMVPVGGRYAIDVDGVKNFDHSRDLSREGVITITLEYEPTLITEQSINDTVIQKITADTRATSARSLFELYVQDAGSRPVVEDNVYLHEIGSNRVFWGKTDKYGKVVFLIPNGSKYLLHFDYKRDIDVYSFKTVRGRGTTQAQVTYRPDPKLANPERFIPAPDEVFVEEFRNFITKQLPEPEEKVGAFLNWGNNRINSNSKHAVLEIGISVSSDRDKVRDIEGVNLSFVIDRSGSMAGYNRIESLKESMVKFVGNMRSYDKVSLVTFNTDAFVDIPLQEVGDGSSIKDYIEEIEPGGGTNIYNGMVQGYEQLLNNYDEQRMNRLILLTDGYGETEPKIVVEKSKEYNEKGIGISAVGVGYDYNSALLTLLTQEAGGLMEHAGRSDDIFSAFENQLASAIFPVGKEAKLTIRYNSKIKFNHLFGLELESDKNDEATFKIGNLFMGQNVISLAQFDLKNPTPEIEQMPVILEISYFDLVSEEYVMYCEKAFLTWDEEYPQLEMLIDQEQKKLYAIAVMNQSVKVMADAFAEDNVPKARYTIERALEQMNELYPDAKDEDVEKLVAQMSNYTKALDNYERKQKIELEKNPGNR